MNDFDYDAMQKKRIARGAYAKKGGSRSKKCTLPDDYLTPAQRAKLSKENVSVSLKAPMTAKEFKLLPTDVKREYLEWLRDEFGANASMIGTDLFQKSKAWLSWYLPRFEPSLIGIFTKSCPRVSKEQRVKWEAWLSGGTKPAEEEPTPEPEPNGRYFKTYTPAPDPFTVEKIDKDSLLTSWEGLRLILIEIANDLLQDYTIEIRVKRGGGE